MVVVADSVVVGVEPADIPFEVFERVLRERNSPALAEARAAYDALLQYRVSIAFLLAIFGHESQYGTDPNAIVVKYDTKNPGNCRSPRMGNPPVINTPRGPFVKYPTWVAGWADLAWRLVDPDYVYVKEGRKTIRQVIERFAPATDGNVPSAYITAVVRDMGRWIREGAMPFEMPGSINGIPVRKSFIPATNSNRPGLPVTFEGARWITVHETGNPNRGANAEMHRRFVHNGGGAGPGNDGVSFTFVVDDAEIIWLVPLEERTWQASDGADGTGNSSTSIETCINADGDFAQACENVAQLIAWLAVNHPKKSIGRIAQHNTWARDKKNCPERMRANNGAGWNALLARVREIAAGGDALYLTYADGRCPHPIVLGFRAWCEALGRVRSPGDMNAGILAVTGYPLEAEWRGKDGRTYQRFERLTLQWNPENQPPFDVVPLLCGTALPERVG